MNGIELASFICLTFGFCESFCLEHSGMPCHKCLHQTAWDMYILGLDMLETDNNPLI